MTTIFREGFETDGNGTRYTTSVTEFTDGFNDFFLRTDGTGINASYEVTGQEGASYFAAQDLDGEGGPDVVSLDITGIDIAGYTDLSFSGLFAEDDSSDGSEDWDEDASVTIEAQIDGGGYVSILQFAETAGSAFNTEPGLDIDFDGFADSTALTAAFARFNALITGTGSVLDLRITVTNLNAGDEDIAFDDFMIEGTPASVEVSVLDETFDNALGFTTNTAFFSDGGFDYFGISDGAGTGDFGGDETPRGLKDYTGNNGAFLTGMDLDGEGASLPITVTWSDLDISGLTGLQFSGDFGEFFDDPGDIDTSDFITLTARIDGGAEQTVLSFVGADLVNGDAFNGFFFQDTNLDGIADGAQLGNALQNFAAAIEGTGSTLDLTLTVSVNAGDEDFAVDNFKVIGTSGGGTPAAVIARTGDGISVAEGSETFDTFTVELATAPTAPVTVTISAPDAQSMISLDGEIFADSIDVVLTDSTAVQIAVMAIDDADDEATPHFGELSFEVSSDDATYNGLSVNDLSVEIADNDFSISLISDIQGSGDASERVGEDITVEAIVTGVITDATGVVGYYLQEEDTDQDADATTSEGIFVFDRGAPHAVGDKLRVTATVDEFSDLTELTDVTEAVTLETGVALPTVTQITIGMSANFEAYEGMRVELVTSSEDPLTVITNFNLDRFGEVIVAEGNQYQPTQLFDAQTQQDEIQALQAHNDANRLTIDDGSTAQNPDAYRLIDSGDGTPLEAGDPITGEGPTLRLGSQVESITGILDERFGGYRLQSDGPLQTIEGTNEDARPDIAPEVGGELKVASFNVLNFFTTIDVSGAGTGPTGTLDPRGADTEEELERQTAKIVAALVELDADIIGLQELENNGFGPDSAIAALVDALNAELGADVYGFVDPGQDFVGTDAITTGLIYKVDAVSVVGSDVLAFEEASAATTFETATALNDYVSSDDQLGDFSRNRPATVATFEDTDGSQITIAVNHFKSKGDSNLEDTYLDALNAGAPAELIEALLADPNYDQGDGQGFWNQARADAAAELAAWLKTNPTGADDTADVLVLGDLNAYAQEDPVQELTDNGYTNLIDQFLGDEAYSFVFDGQRGTLDHGLSGDGLLDNVTGVAEWHINADEPDLLNYDASFNNPAFFNDDFYAASDHDPLVIGLTLDDPTLTARLDFVNVGRFSNAVEYTLEGEAQSEQRISLLSRRPLDLDGVTVSADNGDIRGVEFISSYGDGLSVRSLSSDQRGLGGDASLLDGEETLTFALKDTAGVGDALEVAFEFVNVEGEGDVVLEFFADGSLIDSADLSVLGNAVSYDLASNTAFDAVSVGVTGSLALEISAVEFERLEADELILA